MAGRSSKNNNRGVDLFGYFVSGKYKEFHTNQFAGAVTLSELTATGGVISDYNDPVLERFTEHTSLPHQENLM